MNKIFNNMLRASRVEEGMFEEAKATPELTSHSVAIILLSSIASGIGSLSRIGIAGIILGTFGALASWIVWSGLIYLVILTIAPVDKPLQLSAVDFLRVSGFAASPGIIRAAGIIGPVYTLVLAVSYLWMAALLSVALKKCAGYKTTTEAALICAGSWLGMYVLISVLLGSRVF